MSKVEQIGKKLKELRQLGVSEVEIVKRYESKILSLKNSELSYVFASSVDEANVKAHGKVVIEGENPMWNEWGKKVLKDEYKRNNLIDDTYNFIDNALDEMIEENNQENKSMQKRF